MHGRVRLRDVDTGEGRETSSEFFSHRSRDRDARHRVSRGLHPKVHMHVSKNGLTMQHSIFMAYATRPPLVPTGLSHYSPCRSPIPENSTKTYLGP